MNRAIKKLDDITDLDQIEVYNEETERLAGEAFLKSPVAKLYEREFEYVLGLIVARMKALKAGEEPLPIRPFDADILNRLLSANTIVTYPVAEYDAKEGGITDSLMGETWTFATHQQKSLIEAFLEYATAGAVYAKHIKSTSVRLWARLLDLLQQHHKRTYSRCFDGEADELLRLEHIAVERLRRDMIIEALPPFKKARRKGRR